jgi:hypothetical protein
MRSPFARLHVARSGVARSGVARWLLPFASAGVALACGSGSVPPGDLPADGDGSSASGGSQTVAPNEIVTDGGTVDCNTLARPPTPLRRLTRFEYNSTVRDLFDTTLTPAADFPPDEVVDGFSNNGVVLTVSSLHAEKYTFAAEALAAEVVTKLAVLFPCDPVALGAEACAMQFATTFGRRVYRRALEPEDTAVLLEAFALGSATSYEKGIEIMLRVMLQSPHFLFRVEFTGASPPGTAPSMARLNGYETAARLSYLIWSSAPDDALLDLAAAGGLSTPEQVQAEAGRMLADPKARLAVAEFYRQWLELTRLETTSKDVAAFPLWSEAMKTALQAEATAVVEEVVFGADATLDRLLTAPLGLPTGPLAQLYGVPESATVVELDPAERSGVLSLPGFLAVQAHPDQTSPVLRGKFVRTKLLCDVVTPPPDNVDTSTPNLSEGGTARQRFTAHQTDPSCANCHKAMDPLGYPLESYDALGQFRTMDAGQVLDLSGEFLFTKDIDGAFVGTPAMTDILASSDQVEDCVTKQWFKFAVGRGVEAGDACSLTPLQDAFNVSGANLLDLVVQTTQTEAFLYRRTSEVMP